MTALDLDEIKERLAASTPGTWGVAFEDTVAIDPVQVSPGGWTLKQRIAALDDLDYSDAMSTEDNEADPSEVAERMLADATFIAHAHQDVAALVAEIELLRSAVSS